jgi:predicted transcriptional regulator
MIKKIIIGQNTGLIEKAKKILKDAIEEAKEIKEFEDVTVFATVEALNKVLTVQRKRMLDVIRSTKITSINHLAKCLGRDVKNVHRDLKLLDAYGFVELKREGRRIVPVVPYSRLEVEIPIGKPNELKAAA